jgi:hypothetical protein
MTHTPSQPPPFQKAEMGEGQYIVGWKIQYSLILSILLPPNPFADLGERPGRGLTVLDSIANGLYIQFDIFENVMELVGFRYVDLIEYFDKQVADEAFCLVRLSVTSFRKS